MKRVVAVVLGAGLVGAALAAARGGDAASPGRSGRLATQAAITAIAADGTKVAFRTVRRKGRSMCAQLAVWTIGRRGTVRLREKCTGDNADRYLDPALAGSRLLWVDYDYGIHAYCTGPFTALLPRPKARLLGLCEGDEQDLYLDTAGDGGLAVVSAYTSCEEAECIGDNGEPLPPGDYDVRVFRVSGGKLVRVLAGMDRRKLLAVDAGRIVVREPVRRVVVYSARGEETSSVAVKSGGAQAALTGNSLVIKVGSRLEIHDAVTGELRRTRTVSTRARLRDAHAGIAVYTLGAAIHLVRLSDGRDVLSRRVRGLVSAELEARGLVYAYNRGRRGHLAFVPSGQL